MSRNTPTWQLPPGVSRGTWDYINSSAIAEQYDDFIRDNPLLELDVRRCAELVKRLSQQRAKPVQVVDLGCGTGRLAAALLPLGCQMINVDLSESMLAALESKILPKYASQSKCIHASIVDIADAVEAGSIDLAACLFSSLGMVRGRKYRREVLHGTFATLRTGGQLFLHAHNRYSGLFNPINWKWLFQSRIAGWSRRDTEFGDRVYNYRNLPKMFLHIYSARELIADLRHAEFTKIQLDPISPSGESMLPKTPGWQLRAGGFFATAVKEGS